MDHTLGGYLRFILRKTSRVIPRNNNDLKQAVVIALLLAFFLHPFLYICEETSPGHFEGGFLRSFCTLRRATLKKITQGIGGGRDVSVFGGTGCAQMLGQWTVFSPDEE